jgi:hypothetical protein
MLFLKVYICISPSQKLVDNLCRRPLRGRTQKCTQAAKIEISQQLTVLLLGRVLASPSCHASLYCMSAFRGMSDLLSWKRTRISNSAFRKESLASSKNKDTCPGWGWIPSRASELRGSSMPILFRVLFDLFETNFQIFKSSFSWFSSSSKKNATKLTMSAKGLTLLFDIVLIGARSSIHLLSN